MVYKCANAYYFASINPIGGVESHFYYIAKKYGKYDIAVIYRYCDPEQLKRLRKLVRVIHIKDDDFVECENLFVCYNREILNQVKAKNVYLVLHSDYKSLIEQKYYTRNVLPIDSRIDKYIGVSNVVCDGFTELTGIEAKNVYQPVPLDDIDKPLMFLSATRLSQEKGWDRMVKLAETLDNANVNYLWFIYTKKTSEEQKPTKNMVFCEPRLDITDKLGGFDAYIQLSNNEAYCLSVVEALKRNVPVICTDLPVFEEIGLNTENSIKLPLDMNEIPVDKIKNIDKLKFHYKEPQDRWENVLIKTPSTRGNHKYIVRATDRWKKKNMMDSELEYVPEPNEEWEVTEERLSVIQDYEEKNHIKMVEWRYKDGETEKTDRPETV